MSAVPMTVFGPILAMPYVRYGSDSEDPSMSAARLLHPLARTTWSAGRNAWEGQGGDVPREHRPFAGQLRL